MTRTRSIALSLSVVSLAAGIAAGCGGNSDEGFRNDSSKIDGDPATTLPAELASTKSSVKTRQAGEPLPEQKNITGVSTDLKVKPTIPKATGTAPKELQGSEVVTGTGAQAEGGARGLGRARRRGTGGKGSNPPRLRLRRLFFRQRQGVRHLLE